MKFSVACGVCNERLEWEQGGEASWGVIPVRDYGCAEVTIHDATGEVSKHLNKHREDGSLIEALKKRAELDKGWADKTLEVLK